MKDKSQNEIKADEFVAALIDRLIKTEERCDSLQRELNQHLEMIGELQPRIAKTGQLRFRAFSDEDNSTDEFLVDVCATSVRTLAGDLVGDQLALAPR